MKCLRYFSEFSRAFLRILCVVCEPFVIKLEGKSTLFTTLKDFERILHEWTYDGYSAVDKYQGGGGEYK